MNDRLNDLGIASYSLHLFIAISDCSKKIQNATKKYKVVHECAFHYFSKASYGKIKFNDLTMIMCNYLRATPRISFVILIFASHCVFLF